MVVISLFFNRLNYFRVCRITVDHIPQVLQGIFYAKLPSWQDSPASGNRFFKNERWASRLSPEMISKIKQGNSNNWDATILFHVLLYSSHCLLAMKIPGTQGSLQTGSKEIKATTASADFRKYVSNGCTVLFDLGDSFFCSKVIAGRIQPNDFFIYKMFGFRNTNADIYVCSSEWHLLEELSHIRNEKFAHPDSCSATTRELSILVHDLVRIYRRLNVPQRLITDMQTMSTGKYYVINKTVCSLTS